MLEDSTLFKKTELFKLQFSLLNTVVELLKVFEANPLEASSKLKDYEQILLNFYQVIYWMRPMQAISNLKLRLKEQIQDKEEKCSNLLKLMMDLQGACQDITEDEIMHD